MPGVGGRRAGAGRPVGAKQIVSELARKEAAKDGLLPHEWLLKIARGEPIPQTSWKDILDKRGNFVRKELVTEEVYPPLDMRTDCAKAAAPYYAPRLATQLVTLNPGAAPYPLVDLSKLSSADLGALKKILAAAEK
jgi:hypothetical protein